MSSTQSLTPPPPTPSELYRQSVYLSVSRQPARPAHTVPRALQAEASTSKSSHKRAREPRSELSPESENGRVKRVRELTPAYAEDDRQTTTLTSFETHTGPLSYSAQEPKDDGRVVETSEEGGEESVLFSEQTKETEMVTQVEASTERGAMTEPTEAMGEAEMDDFLPEEAEEEDEAEDDDDEDEGDGEGYGFEVERQPEEEEEEEEDGPDPFISYSETDEHTPEPITTIDTNAWLRAQAGPSNPSSDAVKLSETIGEIGAYIASQPKRASGNEVYLDEPSDESYHSGDSSQYEMDHRPVLERTAVKKDIRKLYDNSKVLQEGLYKIVDRLGEGTFSSVYLAHDVGFNSFDNAGWKTGNSPRNGPPEQSRNDVRVALKKILVTSSPARIENELQILESLRCAAQSLCSYSKLMRYRSPRGCRNVSQLITAFREEDQVIIVLPYHQSDDFRYFYRHMDAHHIQRYMRTLLISLKDIHKRGIVHRDVKPANFLFDYESCEGVLVDFGLAERYVPPRRPTCQHSQATLMSLHGTKVKTAETPAVEQAVYDARKKSKLGEGRIGFAQDDKRPSIKTNRAGTRGFRAPEVLLKCPDQTFAIDIWSAGIMLLSILTHKFPIFNSTDDIEALLEIAAIFGRAAMERCALLHNRTIISNLPSLDSAPPSIMALILKLNPNIYVPPSTNPTKEESTHHIESIDQAIDLCGRLLRLDATKRLTAGQALRHPFLGSLDDGEEEEDEEEQEILVGEDGKCGKLHGRVDGKHVAFFSNDLIEMQFGQGIPESRDSLCPEHQHWQDRVQFNPLALCSHFAQATDGRAPLERRDVNV
ncbi:cell division control protein 7, partial [Tremellales sp. Uapishka_1]